MGIEMGIDAFKVVREFEAQLCRYTGAPFAVTTTSCTMALLLAVAWHLRDVSPWLVDAQRKIAEQLPDGFPDFRLLVNIEIPKCTYVGVPYAIIAAGGKPTFRDQRWEGMYQLRPLPIWDSARWFTSGLFDVMTAGEVEWRRIANKTGKMVCVSFHWAKTLGLQQGGAILHDDPEADKWLRRARFDGRTEGVPVAEDDFPLARAWHAYMSPEIAAQGLVKLSHLSPHNAPIPWDNYPDLSKIKAFA